MLPPLPSTYCRSHSLRPTRIISWRKASASGELAAARGGFSSTSRVSEFKATPAGGVAFAASLPFSANGTAVCCIVDLTPGLTCRALASTSVLTDYIERLPNANPKRTIPTSRCDEVHSFTVTQEIGGRGGTFRGTDRAHP